MQREVEVTAQLRVAAQVGRDVAGELDAAGADERHLDHSSAVFHPSSIRARVSILSGPSPGFDALRKARATPRTAAGPGILLLSRAASTGNRPRAQGLTS